MSGRYTRGTWRRVKNNHGTTAPAGGFAKIVTPGIDTTKDVLTITRPDDDDLSNVLIVAEDIPASGYGIAYESGTIPLLWNGTTPVVDDRLGSQTDSWYGAVSDDGTHLVRAISGGVAHGFFTAPSADGRIYLSEWAQVRSSTPGSTFSYSTPTSGSTGFQARRWDTGVEYRAVQKFERVLPAYSLPAHYIFGTSIQNYMQSNPPATGDSGMRSILNVRFITEDFDCSTVTYTSLAALAKTGTVVVVDWELRNMEHDVVGGNSWNDYRAVARGIAGITWSSDWPGPIVEGVYGSEVYFSMFAGPDESFALFSSEVRQSSEMISHFQGA